jgi:hypothetical protein
MGAKISNNSWGGTAFSQALSDSVTAARAANHLVVAAAGNSAANADFSPSYPASLPQDNIISVAASDNNDARASFSNFGSGSVDLAAPGVTIYSPRLATYAYLNGTSMAAPHVAGVAALLLSLNPAWSYAQIRDRIFGTVRNLPAFKSITRTGGALDAHAAVNSAVVANQAPVVLITSPAPDAVVSSTTAVTLSATATDPESVLNLATLAWSSNLSGPLGTGATLSRTLTQGLHVITASITDAGGRTGASSIRVSVGVAGGTQPPLDALVTPGNFAVTRVGTNAVLSWTDLSSSEFLTRVERQQLLNGVWSTPVTVAQIGRNVTTYSNPVGTGTASGAGTYGYRVRHESSAGTVTAWTAWVQVVAP